MFSSRSHSVHATVVAYLALTLALSGTATAAVLITGAGVKDSSLTGADVKDGSITGADVRDSSLTGVDVKNSSLTGADVKDGSLTGADIKAGSIPANRIAGGLPATDLSNVYTKTQSDGLFLAKTGKAADADTIDGLDSTALAKGNVTTTTTRSVATLGQSSMSLAVISGWAHVDLLNCISGSSPQANASIVNTGTSELWAESSTLPAGFHLAANWVSAGTPLATSGWETLHLVRGTGAATQSADIDVHTAGTAAGCVFVVTSRVYG